MNLFDTITNVFDTTLLFIFSTLLLGIGGVITVSKLPRDNPLRQILYLLSLRVGATIGAAVVGLPIETIPGVDIAYDVAAPVALLVYWGTFAFEIAQILRAPRSDGGRSDSGTVLEASGTDAESQLEAPQLSGRVHAPAPRMPK